MKSFQDRFDAKIDKPYVVTMSTGKQFMADTYRYIPPSLIAVKAENENDPGRWIIMGLRLTQAGVPRKDHMRDWKPIEAEDVPDGVRWQARLFYEQQGIEATGYFKRLADLANYPLVVKKP